MPPSPRLSARMITLTYLSVTTSIIAQNTSDRMPSTLAGSGCRPYFSPKASLSVYSGLVPMSPNTTPIAPSTRGHVLAVVGDAPSWVAWVMVCPASAVAKHGF